MITVFSSMLGTIAGIIFAVGSGWFAACIAAIAQVFDGVDGQFSRLTKCQSTAGALLDSVLDRYSDGAMVIGATIYLIRFSTTLPVWVILVIGSLALIGGNLISYSSSRAENLEIDTGRPTLASKGTRMTVMVLSGWGTIFWPDLPLFALCYLSIHTNIVVACRMVNAHRDSQSA
jgi:phosphatidylglycerophosphate synthase